MALSFLQCINPSSDQKRSLRRERIGVAADPLDEDNPIEALLLTGFPNPERIGCLSLDVIEGLGQRTISRDDPAWRHIWNCSPCFRDFKVIRDRRLSEVERLREKKEVLKRNGVIAAVLVFAAITGFVILPRPHPTNEAFVVPINLLNVGTSRGSESIDNGVILAKLPRRLDELRITLPRFSRGGRYIVGILKSKSENTAIALGSAIATTAQDKQTVILVLKLDLSTAESGRYFLATRFEQGEEGAAYYYPVLIDAGQSLSQLIIHFAQPRN